MLRLIVLTTKGDNSTVTIFTSRANMNHILLTALKRPSRCYDVFFSPFSVNVHAVSAITRRNIWRSILEIWNVPIVLCYNRKMYECGGSHAAYAIKDVNCIRFQCQKQGVAFYGSKGTKLMKTPQDMHHTHCVV